MTKPIRTSHFLAAAIRFTTFPAFAQTTAPASAPAAGPTWGNANTLVTPEDEGFTVDIHNNQLLIATGRTGCPIAVVGHEVWDLQKQKKTAVKIPHTGDRDSLFALSDDGSLLALGHSRRSRLDPDATVDATLWNTTTGEKVCEIPAADRDHDMDFLGLAANRFLLIAARPNGVRKPVMEVWDAHTGKLVRRFPCIFSGAGTTSLSPDGRYVALADAEHVLVYDLDSGQQVASMAPPENAPHGVRVHANHAGVSVAPTLMPFTSLSGLAFSPDGSELAAASSFTNTFFSWNNQAALTRSFSFVSNEFEFHSPRPFLQWSPDHNTWLVNQHWLVDLKTQRPLWTLPVPFADEPESLFLDDSRLFVFHHSHNARNEVVAIPWDAIHRALDRMNDPKTVALLLPGKSISLDIQCKSPGDDNDHTLRLLTETFTARLATMDIKVADNQPSVLSVRFEETIDPPAKIVIRPSPFDQNLTPTDRTASPAHGTLTLRIHAGTSDKDRWTTTLASESPPISNETITSAALEKSMLDSLLNEITRTPLPYFLSDDDQPATLPLGMAPNDRPARRRLARTPRQVPLIESPPFDPFHHAPPQHTAPPADDPTPRQRT